MSCKDDCSAGSYINSDKTSCAVCIAGQYQNQNDQSSCENCAEGKYNDQTGQTLPSICKYCPEGFSYENKETVCNACNSGKYQDQNEQSAKNPAQQCVDCPGGWSQIIQSAIDCDICNAGLYANRGHSNTGQGTCIKCPAGYSQAHNAQEGCSQCPAGKYMDEQGKTECSLCPKGTYLNIKNNLNKKNPIGSISNACKVCDKGQFQNTTGKTACKVCLSGRYSTGESSGKWQQRANDFDTFEDCKLCPSGFYTAFESSKECAVCTNATGGTQHCENEVDGLGCSDCIGCRMGKYAAAAGSTDDCIDCPSGFFALEMNAPACTECPGGFFVNKTEARSCSMCPSGFFDHSSSTSCKACAAGYYQNKDATLACKECPRGTYSTIEALVDVSLCTSCLSGKYSTMKAAMNRSVCLDCSIGLYSSTWKATDESVCKRCQPGTYGGASGASLCKQCGPGQTQDRAGQSACKNCEKGFFTDKAGSLDFDCTKCPAGYSQAHNGQSVCRICRAGTYQAFESEIQCQACLATTYSKEDGVSMCMACPKGWSSSNQGQKTCVQCSTGMYSPEDGQECQSCPAGFQQNSGGGTACKRCLPGLFQPTENGVSCERCLPGFYSNNAINTANYSFCPECPTGYFSETTGKVQCALCPVGFMANGRQPACQECPPGQFGVDDDTIALCRDCPAGYSQSLPTYSMCTMCREGKYSVVGRPYCNECPAGWSAALGSSNMTCHACPAGYKSFASSGKCDICQPGFISTSQSQSCIACEKGQYYDNVTVVASVCELCDASQLFYQDETNATACKQCSVGEIVVADECLVRDKTIVALQNSPSNLNIHVLKRSDGRYDVGSTLRFTWEWDFEDASQSDLQGFVLTYAIARGGDDSCELGVDYDPGVDMNRTTTSMTIDIDLDIHGWCNPISKASVYAIINGQPSLSTLFNTQWTPARRCSKEKYLNTDSEDPSEWVCVPCPLGASCDGPVTWSGVRALFGYYRNIIEIDDQNSTIHHRQRRRRTVGSSRGSGPRRDVVFVPCKFPPACLGAKNVDMIGLYEDSNNTDPSQADNQEMCNEKEGYKRYCNDTSTLSSSPIVCRVCGTCKAGYSRDLGGASYRCSECPKNSESTTAILVLSFLSLIVIVVVLIVNAMADAAKDLASDALQKIIVNYLQAAAIALSFPLKWPKALVAFFNMQGAISTVGEFLVNPNCQFSWMNAANLFYAKLLAYALLPIICLLLSWIWWRIVAHCVRKVPWSSEDNGENTEENDEENEGYMYVPDPKDQFILSVIVQLYLLYPTICQQIFRLFTCVEIGEGSWYLSADLQVECFHEIHLSMVLFLGIPQILVYILGLPLLGLSAMHFSHEHGNNNPTIKYRYGVLYSGYRPGMLYWEVVVALRKVLVAALVVLVSEVGVSMQIHLGMFVLMFALIAHLFAKPFVSHWSLLGQFETASLVICWLTLWSGIVYIHNSEHNRKNSVDGGLTVSTDASAAQFRVDLTTSFIILTNSFFLLTSIVVVLHQKLVDEPTCCNTFFQRTKMGRFISNCLSRVPLVETEHDTRKRRQQYDSKRLARKRIAGRNRNQKVTLRQKKSVEMTASVSILQSATDNNSSNEGNSTHRPKLVSMGGREWIEYFDQERNQNYYHSKTDGVTQWENPLNQHFDSQLQHSSM